MLRSIVRSESFGGVLLFACAVFAIILDNSSLAYLYESLIHTPLTIHLGELNLSKPLYIWINEGLMTIFFLLVGLEIKREVLKGVLHSINDVLLPSIGALGGLVFPALIYIYFNHDDPIAMRGWAIPVATDIAFSLGILSLLGDMVPRALKMFLSALAIIDDIMAVLIIAVFYTAELSITSLFLACNAIIILIAMNRLQIAKLVPYYLVGIGLWLAVLQSGVHATLAGVVLAFAIPMEDTHDASYSPLIYTERCLQPWVVFVVLPLFAFVNAGFSFTGLGAYHLFDSIPIGIILGLFIGKQVGIFSSCWLLIKTGLAKLHKDLHWADLYGIAVLCGVGFTMSLFIGGLAFGHQDVHYSKMLKLGVLTGSALSGLVGYFVLYCVRKHYQKAS